MSNFIKKRPILLFSSFALTTSLFGGSCDAYLSENQIEGITPKIVNGKLKSLSMYGSSSFIAVKSSLISKARKKAEMKAKRSFSQWLKEGISGNTLTKDILKQTEKTDQDGNTEGVAEEISMYADQMASNTSAVLSGIIKLDECMSPEDKTIYVRVGWKPSLSKMSANASNAIKESHKPKKKSAKKSASKTKNVDDGGSSVKIITVQTVGIGANQVNALNSALKQAVSQVFGEQFSATTNTSEVLVTAEATDSSGNSAGVALESSAMQESIKSKTKGLIHSYSIVSKKNGSSGLEITVSVKLAKYDKGLDSSKKSIVVLHPTYSAKNSSVNPSDFSRQLQDSIESELSASNLFNILDRENLGSINKEMNFISANGDLSEIARLGNMAGADRIVITSIEKYTSEEKERKVADRIIKKNLLTAKITLKIIDPATTRVVLSRNITVNRKSFNGELSIEKHIAYIGGRVSNAIGTTTGKRSHARGNRAERKRETQSVEKAEKEANAKYNKLKEESNEDW